MGQRDDARHQVEQRRERIGALAHEVSRRMTPDYAKERAREMARHKAYEVRERAVDSGWLIPLIGAGVGAMVGKALRSRAQDRDDRTYGRYDLGRGNPYPYAAAYGAPERWRDQSGFEGEHTGQSEGDGSSRLADKASEMKEKVSAKADEYGDRLREGTHALRDRMPDREQISASAREDMGLWAFGAIALGALFGMVLPVSEKERELLEPAKRRVREAGQQARDLAIEKGSDALDQVNAKVEGEDEQQEQTRTTQSPIIPTTTIMTPIH